MKVSFSNIGEPKPAKKIILDTVPDDTIWTMIVSYEIELEQKSLSIKNPIYIPRIGEQFAIDSELSVTVNQISYDYANFIINLICK